MLKKYFFITSALPYANGILHFGHILEFIQSDIWIRFQKQKKICIFISGTDMHGTPIMIKSGKLKIKSENLIGIYFYCHKYLLKKYFVNVDNFYYTHSLENIKLVFFLFFNLLKNGFFFMKNINQYYDNLFCIFLPDRYILGKCFNCLNIIRYNDICEYCDIKCNIFNLLQPRSVFTSSIPIIKKSKHIFFNLNYLNLYIKKNCYNVLKQKSVLNKINEWLSFELENWNMSRDYPYFGFKISNFYKYFYVWFDASLNYLSILNNLFYKIKINYNFFYNRSIFCNFLGKDIVYFHILFFFGILKSYNIKLYNNIFVHGFIFIKNKKISKSFNNFRGDFYYIPSDYIRYYFASKLSYNIYDINLDIYDFIDKINSGFIAKFLNIFNRCYKLINIYFDNNLSDSIFDIFLFDKLFSKISLFINLYYNKFFSKIILHVMFLSNYINYYINKNKPWNIISVNKKKTHMLCTTIINLFVSLSLNIRFIIPLFNNYLKNILGIYCDKFNIFKPYLNIKLKKYKLFLFKLDYYVFS